MNKILLSAHSCGPEGKYIPNSLEALMAVRDIGVDLIEFDVRLSKDDELVSAHDEQIEIDGKSLPVSEINSADLIKKAGICDLQTMLNASKGHALVQIDLKDKGVEDRVVNMCVSTLGSRGFIITTLEDDSVLTIRRDFPDVDVALSLGRDLSGATLRKKIAVRTSELFPGRRVARCQPTNLTMHYTIARLGVLRWAYRKHLPVLVWTINDPKIMPKIWKNKYIWAFTTDFPRKALAKRH